jgi:hypothetical protein
MVPFAIEDHAAVASPVVVAGDSETPAEPPAH